MTKSREVQSAHDVQASVVRACVDSVQQELRDTREVTTRSQESEEQLPECRDLFSPSPDTAIQTGLCVHRSGDWAV